MASTESDLENVHVSERHLWLDGPPHELFRELRGRCPVHWTAKITRVPARGRATGRSRPRTTCTP